MRTKVDILQKKNLLEHHPSSCVLRFRFLVSEFSPLILGFQLNQPPIKPSKDKIRKKHKKDIKKEKKPHGNSESTIPTSLIPARGVRVFVIILVNPQVNWRKIQHRHLEESYLPNSKENSSSLPVCSTFHFIGLKDKRSRLNFDSISLN